MSEFRKYMHVERYGNDEVQGIELGTCYVFPKLDGTNGSIWLHDNEVCCGSRNRHLSLDADNQGFLEYISQKKGIKEFLIDNPTYTLYGEWLVPHTIKTYSEDAWRKFYVFDVYCNEDDRYLAYDDYRDDMDYYGLDYISPLKIIKNANYENLLHELHKNYFLVEDGKGCGEGVVIKNYSYINKFNSTCWAKLITNSFKERHTKTMGSSEIVNKMIEQEIVDSFVSKHLVDKVYAKIVNECDGWNSKYIPRLLQTVYYDLVNEEIWNIVKKMKYPIINFRTLHTLTVMEIKSLKPELF